MAPKTDPESSVEGSATALLASAAEFGLTRDEILKSVTVALDGLPEDTRVRCIDELAGGLAARLLEKQRRSELRQSRP
jgi:hypothetical protein